MRHKVRKSSSRGCVISLLCCGNVNLAARNAQHITKNKPPRNSEPDRAWGCEWKIEIFFDEWCTVAYRHGHIKLSESKIHRATQRTMICGVFFCWILMFFTDRIVAVAWCGQTVFKKCSSSMWCGGEGCEEGSLERVIHGWHVFLSLVSGQWKIRSV